MERINWARVFAGGLLAGLIINIGEFILNVPPHGGGIRCGCHVDEP